MWRTSAWHNLFVPKYMCIIYVPKGTRRMRCIPRNSALGVAIWNQQQNRRSPDVANHHRNMGDRHEAKRAKFKTIVIYTSVYVLNNEMTCLAAGIIWVLHILWIISSCIFVRRVLWLRRMANTSSLSPGAANHSAFMHHMVIVNVRVFVHTAVQTRNISMYPKKHTHKLNWWLGMYTDCVDTCFVSEILYDCLCAKVLNCWCIWSILYGLVYSQYQTSCWQKCAHKHKSIPWRTKKRNGQRR